jgi:3,4-dihydroxy 2-butanone 4-phosphate synthase/GTP cyclohydrolase II
VKDHASHAVERVERAIAYMRAGKMVILTDDEDRENEGDLCMAAERVTPAAVNFMAKHGRGLVCLSLTEEKVRQLRLPLMVDESANTSSFGTAFTISIEAKEGVTTGISARDRAHTILTAVKDKARPEVSSTSSSSRWTAPACASTASSSPRRVRTASRARPT